jgi:hypothetical protein
MGLKHEAKKGTTIVANGVRVTVLRGSPLLDITAPAEINIAHDGQSVLTKPRAKSNNDRRSKVRR